MIITAYVFSKAYAVFLFFEEVFIVIIVNFFSKTDLINHLKYRKKPVFIDFLNPMNGKVISLYYIATNYKNIKSIYTTTMTAGFYIPKQ